MKNSLLKIVCLLFAIAMMLPTFAACKKNKGEGDTTAAQNAQGEVTTVEEEVPPVPETDWGGELFTVLSLKHYVEPNFEVVGMAKGNNVSAAVYKRNLAIADRYGVDIQEYGDANLDYVELLEKTLENGDDPFDLVFLYRDDMARAIQMGLMKELSNVSYLNLENDWYNDNTINSMKISGRLFHMVSDFSLIDKARTNVLFLNRDLAAANQIPDILASVKDGNWTIEKMLEYQQTVAHDTGDGVLDLNDYWGLACGGIEACSTFWVALGNQVVTVDDDETFSVNLATTKSINSIEKVRKIYDETLSFSEDKFGTTSDAFNAFVEQRCLFLSETLSTIEKISPVAEFSFTALPYPKYDTAQAQYYTTNDNTFCATFGIPVCARDFSFSGFMIEVLSWQSHTTTFPEYYNKVCKVQNSYDAECAAMLDLVFEGLIFDFGLINSQNVKGLRNMLQKSILKGENITSLYEGEAERFDNEIQMIFDSMKEINTEA